MTTRTRRGRGTSRRQRRRTRWLDVIAGSDLNSGGFVNTRIDESLGREHLVGHTVMAMRLSFFAQPTSPAAVNGTQVLDWGIGVIERDAFSINAVPDPNVPGDRPPLGWMARGRITVPDEVGGNNSALYQYPPDQLIKSRRRIHNGVLLLSATNSSLVGTAFNVTWRISCRVLVALP